MESVQVPQAMPAGAVAVGCAVGIATVLICRHGFWLQVQHIVSLPPGPASLAEPDPSDPSLLRLRKMLAGLDVDGDGAASRRDMLLAFRRDRQLADHLKMPPRVKVSERTASATPH